MKGSGAARPDAAPHVTLREAVRPAIVAYGILARQQQAAGTLVEEAQNLLELTEELLRKLGIVHLLGAGIATEPTGDVAGDQAGRLAAAYAAAGMAWARVVGSATELARCLIERNDWSEVAHMADLVAETGEIAAAEHIRDLAERAVVALCGSIRTHRAMTAPETRAAAEALKSLDRRFGPHREEAIRLRRMDLVRCLETIAAKHPDRQALASMTQLRERLETLVRHPGLEDHGQYRVPEDELFNRIFTALDMIEGQEARCPSA